MSAETENSKFWTEFARTGYFWSKKRKGEHHHRIQHIQSSLGTKFTLKQTILNFWAKFAPKKYFLSKKQKYEQHH